MKESSDLVRTKAGTKLQCPLCGKQFAPKAELSEFESHLADLHPWKGDSCEAGDEPEHELDPDDDQTSSETSSGKRNRSKRT